jgi:ribosomal protein S18 acetylase RimI-like enzyme
MPTIAHVTVRTSEEFMADWHLRPALPVDLAAAFAIYADYEFGATASAAERTVPGYLAHLLDHGRVLVAEQGGRIAGFAGLAARDGVAFLSDLFVRPDAQSGALGGALLRAILPEDGVCCTCSTSDPRALALYIRAGMRPCWPQYLLHYGADGRREDANTFLASGYEIVESDATDPDFATWEAEIGGRQRRDDLSFWAAAQGGQFIWFRRGGATVGYAVIRLHGGTVTHPAAITLGPLGVREQRDALPCVLAAVTWARGRGEELCLMIPGPHPALAPLLERGFRIVDSYTFVASDGGAFADPQRYLSSGPDIF